MDIRKVICPYSRCGQELASSEPDALFKHVQAVHSPQTLLRRIVRIKDVEPPHSDHEYVCEFQDCITGTTNWMRNSFPSEARLIRHQAEVHAASKNFSCVECDHGMRFKTKDTLVQHLRRLHRITDKQVVKDKSRQSRPQSSEESLATAEEDRNAYRHRCRIFGCGQLFSWEQNLHSHMQDYHSTSSNRPKSAITDMDKEDDFDSSKPVESRAEVVTDDTEQDLGGYKKVDGGYQCAMPGCSRSSNIMTWPGIKNHMTKLHNEFSNKVKYRVCPVEGCFWKCTITGKTQVYVESALRVHIRTVHDHQQEHKPVVNLQDILPAAVGRVLCRFEDCVVSANNKTRMSFKKVSEREYHEERVHSSLRAASCVICDHRKRFKQKDTLLKHLERAHNLRDAKSIKENLRKSQPPSEEERAAAERDQSLRQCPIEDCRKYFMRDQNRLAHIQASHGDSEQARQILDHSAQMDDEEQDHESEIHSEDEDDWEEDQDDEIAEEASQDSGDTSDEEPAGPSSARTVPISASELLVVDTNPDEADETREAAHDGASAIRSIPVSKNQSPAALSLTVSAHEAITLPSFSDLNLPDPDLPVRWERVGHVRQG